jgi:hypothetical protein
MSLQSYFVQRATSEGLRFPGAPGVQTEQSAAYKGVMQRLHQRKATTAAILGGKSLGGIARVDASSPFAAEDAEFLARTAEWAEFLGSMPGMASDYRRLDSAARPKQLIADGKAFARHFSGLGNAPRFRADAKRMDAVAPMASQGLSFILPQVYEYQHNDLPMWEEKVLKIYRGADPAANEVVWYEMDNIGVAQAGNSYDRTTIPLVNGPLASDNKLLIVPALVGMETNFMDMRRAAMAERMGKPDFMIEVMKRRACERALAEFFDNLWFAGDATLGIDGLMNNPAVSTLGLTSGAWSGLTALGILADLTTMVYAIPNNTAGALPDLSKITIYLPPSQYQRASSIPVTSAGSTSVLTFFMDSMKAGGMGVPKIETQYRFAAANSQVYNGGPTVLSQDTALIVYQDGDPNVDPTFVLTQPIEVPAPVVQTGLGDVTYFHARGGGLKMPDARRMLYVTGL